MKSAPVYLDYNATAPIRPEVLALTHAVMAETGNASSVHSFGQRARAHVERAREQVAAAVGVKPAQVVFTSGATESNNTALHGYAHKRVLISAIEHPAVSDAAPHAEIIPVTRDGAAGLDAFEKMLSEGEPPAIVSVMMVNSETGVIQPVAEIAAMARAAGALIHTDAVQALGRIKVDFGALGVDAMSLSAHKIAGPQGVGALIIREGLAFNKFMKGGSQERLLRGGTVNAAGIAGFGLAAEIAVSALPTYHRIAAMRDRMEARILELCPQAILCGRAAPRVGNTSSIALPGVPAQTQLMALDLAGVAVSSGSACSSGSFKPSHVLKAMGYDDAAISSALRVSMGWATTEADIYRFIDAWAQMMRRVQ